MAATSPSYPTPEHWAYARRCKVSTRPDRPVFPGRFGNDALMLTAPGQTLVDVGDQAG